MITSVLIQVIFEEGGDWNYIESNTKELTEVLYNGNCRGKKISALMLYIPIASSSTSSTRLIYDFVLAKNYPHINPWRLP